MAVAEKHNIKAQKLLQFNKVDKKLNRIEEDQENADKQSQIVNLSIMYK